MITRAQLSQMRPQEKAELIYSQARAEAVGRLWKAALGDADRDSSPVETAAAEPSGMGLQSLLNLIATNETPRPSPAPAQAEQAIPAAEEALSSGGGGVGLGPTSLHEASLDRAASRTGIPAAALAAIVDAEAAKGPGGRWQTMSRNPRSSAAGLGQFLSGSWVGEAQRPGTYLNEIARTRGWLNGNGKLLEGCKGARLALRYDGDVSINAIADYAKGNLDRLRHAGVDVGTSAKEIAQNAYLGHHLGAGDAIRFMKVGLDPARARTLLFAQGGAARASQRIAATGDASHAHRAWLREYGGRHVQPAKVAAA